MIFNITFFLSIVLFLYEVNKTFKKGSYISIQVIITFCLILFILLPPFLSSSVLLEDDAYNTLLFFGFLGVFISCRILPYDIILEAKPKYVIDKFWTKIGFLVFSFYLVGDIIKNIIAKGSLLAVFTSTRLEFDTISSTGSFVYSIMLFFRILYYVYIYSLFKQKKHFKFLLLYLIPIFHHQVTAITRFDFLVMVLVVFFLYIEPKLLKRKLKNRLNKSRRISKKKLIVIISPIILFSLFYMYTSNLIRHGLLQERADKITLDALFNSDLTNDLEYYYLLHDLYVAKDIGKIDYEYGKSWFYYPLLTYIPRNIWADKPPTAFSTRYTEKLYWKLGDGPVATFTIFGEGYIQFGLLGAFFAPIFFSVSRYWSLSYLKRIENSRIIIILILFSMITYFRAEQPIVYVLLDLIYGFIIMKFMSKKIIR